MLERRQVSAMRAARVLAGVRLVEVANEIGIPESRLSVLERGLSKPRPEEIPALRRAYGEAVGR
jgi:hypothetical protein